MSNFVPHMPDVDDLSPEKLEKVFTMAAQANVPGGGQPDSKSAQRQITLITPGRMIAQLPCPPPNSMDAKSVQQIAQILPANPPRKVVAIAYTALDALIGDDKKITVQSVSRVIPFIGFLIGFGYIGHTVYVFEGHPLAFAAGVGGADMLLVDERMVPFLQKGWVDVAYSVMRTPTINVFQPGGAVQQVVRKPK